MKKIIKRCRTNFNYSIDPYHKYQIKYRKFTSYEYYTINYEYYTINSIENLIVSLIEQENEQEIFNKEDK